MNSTKMMKEFLPLKCFQMYFICFITVKRKIILGLDIVKYDDDDV